MNAFFVDDLKENIDAAIKVGMKGFVYHQNIQELEKYRKYLIKVWIIIFYDKYSYFFFTYKYFVIK